MGFYLGEEGKEGHASDKKLITISYYNSFTGDNRITRVNITRGNNDSILDDYIDHHTMINGMRMVILTAQHRGEDYHDYPYMQEGNVNPKECEWLDYEYNEKYLTITTPYGDYSTIRWDKLTEKKIDPSTDTGRNITWQNLAKRKTIR